MKRKKLEKIKEVVEEEYPELGLVYLFGSKARNDDSALSDYDFAIYCRDDLNKKELVEKKIEILSELCKILQTDEIDVSVLNLIQSPEFKYNVITEGKLIYQKEPYKIDFETDVLNRYFDFLNYLRKYDLTAG